MLGILSWPCQQVHLAYVQIAHDLRADAVSKQVHSGFRARQPAYRGWPPRFQDSNCLNSNRTPAWQLSMTTTPEGAAAIAFEGSGHAPAMAAVAHFEQSSSVWSVRARAPAFRARASISPCTSARCGEPLGVVAVQSPRGTRPAAVCMRRWPRRSTMRLVLAAVLDQVGDGADLDAVLAGETRSGRAGAPWCRRRSALRRSPTAGRQAGQRRQVAAGLGVAGAHQHAAVRRLQRKDMAGLDQVGRLGVARDRGLHGARAVGGRNAGVTPFGGFDGHGEIGAVRGAVAR